MSINRSNIIIEHSQKYVTPPLLSPTDLGGPTVYMHMLNDISSPRERVLTFYKSIFNPLVTPTQEAHTLRVMVGGSLAVGCFVGFLIHKEELIDRYVRQHNASVFQGKFMAERHRVDNMALEFFRKGSKLAIRSSLLTATVGTLAFSSILYRGKLYLPDWLLGFAAIGGLSRLWLGPRAVAVGTGVGLVAGMIGYGFSRSIEFIHQESVSEIAYHNHTDFLNRRSEYIRSSQLKSQDEILAQIADAAK